MIRNLQVFRHVSRFDNWRQNSSLDVETKRGMKTCSKRGAVDRE